MSIQKAPKRAAAGSDTLFAQFCKRFLQSQIWLFRNNSQDFNSELFERRGTSAARLRGSALLSIPALQPLYRRAYAYLEPFGRLASRRTHLYRFDNAFP
jgi:hypothetical protein